MLIAVDCSDGLTSAVQLIPKLWPFLNHSIRSVRRATLRTMSVLLSTGRLKVYVDVQLLFEGLVVVTYGLDVKQYNYMQLCHAIH